VKRFGNWACSAAEMSGLQASSARATKGESVIRGSAECLQPRWIRSSASSASVLNPLKLGIVTATFACGRPYARV